MSRTTLPEPSIFPRSKHRLTFRNLSNGSPTCTSSGQQNTSVLRIGWGIARVLLFAGVFKSGTGMASYAGLEESGAARQTPSGTDWFSVHEADAHLLESGARSVLKSSHDRVQCPADLAP